MDIYTCFWEVYRQDKGISWEELYYYSVYNQVYFDNEELTILFNLASEASKWLYKKNNSSK